MIWCANISSRWLLEMKKALTLHGGLISLVLKENNGQ
jgi:hypothetical protein